MRDVHSRPGDLATLIVAAKAGDEPAFTALTERHRRELQVHCYRMLGSLEDAEDLVQETFLRAWRRRRSFTGRSTFRAWLYGIATNACIDALRRHPRRVVATEVAAGADPGDELAPAADLPWLQPYPDRLLESVADGAAEPDTEIVRRETIELAFLAAIQHLPPRQRAVLILRDALGWSAAETGSLIGASAAAVNSALQRARATMKAQLPEERADWPRGTAAAARERALLGRYMRALERNDVDGLVALLTEDARITMPPHPAWFEGRSAVAEFHARNVLVEQHEWRQVATAANRQPATASYLRRRGEREYGAFSIDVLRVEDGRIAEITAFILPELFPAFGLPPSL